MTKDAVECLKKLGRFVNPESGSGESWLIVSWKEKENIIRENENSRMLERIHESKLNLNTEASQIQEIADKTIITPKSNQNNSITTRNETSNIPQYNFLGFYPGLFPDRSSYNKWNSKVLFEGSTITRNYVFNKAPPITFSVPLQPKMSEYSIQFNALSAFRPTISLDD